MKILALLLSILLSYSHTAIAASSTIFGKSTNALECYRMAEELAKNGDALLASTAACDLALEEFLSTRDRASTLVNRGLIYARQQKFDEAFEDYEQAIQASERIRPTAFINIGNAHFLQEDFGSAIENYNEALALGVNETHAATLNRGMAYEKLGELKLAEQDYLGCLSLIPEWDDALVRLERVRGKIAKAKSHQ